MLHNYAQLKINKINVNKIMMINYSETPQTHGYKNALFRYFLL
jgi:hypothetical protein